MECEITAQLIEAMKRELGVSPPADTTPEDLFLMFDKALEYPPKQPAAH